MTDPTNQAAAGPATSDHPAQHSPADPDPGPAGATGSNVSRDSLELFTRSWQAYRHVVDLDLMEHRALTAALETLLLQRGGGAPLGWMADLGCGDLGLLAPILQRLPLAGLIGVDAAAAVLPLAAARMEGSPFPCQWVSADLLAWSEARRDQRAADPHAPGAEPLSLVSCLFALHHLDDAHKRRVLEALHPCLAADGCLLVADVFRADGEDRPTYIQRYLQRVASQWQELPAAERQLVGDHLSASDFPAEREAFRQLAAAAGWRSRWLWNGSHGAEALLLLEPSR